MPDYVTTGGNSDDQTIAQVQKNYDDAMVVLAPYHTEFDELYRFMFKRDRYDDARANERDRRRSKPSGRQIDSKHRRKVAQIMKQALYLSTRGVDVGSDPKQAEDVRWFMEYEVHDPRKRFMRILRRAVSLALGASGGAIGLKVHYDLGPYPEVRPYLMDPRSLWWTPGWQDPDDDTCPYVGWDETWTIEAVEAMKDYGWKNTAALRSEGLPSSSVTGRSGDPARPIGQYASNGLPGPGSVERSNAIKVRFCWYRFDQSTKSTQSEYKLEPEDQYLACPNCPFKDYSHEPAPEHGGMCPDCAKLGTQSPLGLVSTEIVPEEVRAYADGKRLCIVAPDQKRVLYDDAWPWDINGRPIRNVPVCFIRCYDTPLEPWGACDTQWDFSSQVIANALDRRLYEFMSQAGAIIIAGEQGLWNANNTAPYEFTNRPISLARWRGMGEPQVKTFVPSGMVAEILPFMNYWNGQFRADMGISDLGLTAQQSKDIPVGTVRSLTESGEIPVDDHAVQIREALSPLIGTWYDIKRAIMKERQAVRLRGPDGADVLRKMRGEEFPNADVIVGAPPSWDQFDAERVAQLRELLSTPPGIDPMLWWTRVVPVFAEAANIPMETVRKLQEALAPPPQVGPPQGAGMPGQAGMPAAAPNGNGIPAPIASRMTSMVPMGPQS